MGGEAALQIDAIVTGGDGMGRGPDGRVVFVPRTAPGDRIEIEYLKAHKQWSRGRLVRVIEPGPDRRDPPCPHYDDCGGCQLQHLHYEAQIRAKAGMVSDCLRRLGGLDISTPDVVRSAEEFEYRNRVTFVLRRAGDHVVAGYHSHRNPGAIVDIDRCPLAEPAINRVWATLRHEWGPGARLLPPGRELRLTLRGSEAGMVVLLIEGADEPGPLDALIGCVDLSAAWSLDPCGAVMSHAGATSFSDRWGPYDLQVAGDAFLQVNRDVATKLEAHVREQCGDVAGRRVIDAYCGIGVRAMALAERGARVVGIDSDRHAISAARGTASEWGLSVRFEHAAVERALARELPADLVILNPPRRGVARRVLESLVERPPARILYVSCDPATLARDLKHLTPELGVGAIRVFDMVPQTGRLEVVATLTRRAGHGVAAADA